MIKDLLNYALEQNASDLHLSVGSIPMIRIDGKMNKLNLPEMTLDNMEKIQNEVLSKDQHTVFKERLEIDFSTSLEDKGRFRVNFFHQINGISAVFRAIPNEIKSSTELNLPPIINQLSMMDKGLILLTGPTGCGKSTTLAAMLDNVNEQKNAQNSKIARRQ